MIENHTDAFYQNLMAWNLKFGSGVDDITAKWELALSTIRQAQMAAQDASQQAPPSQSNWWGHLPGFDEGGFAGGAPTLDDSKIFAQLMKGEFQSTPQMMHNFVSSTLPNLIATTNNNNQGNIEINVPVAIYGSPDKNTVDTLTDKIFAKINKALQIQGHTRSGMAFSV
jgi:hypothetical protein